jgi:hypothetical protein
LRLRASASALQPVSVPESGQALLELVLALAQALPPAWLHLASASVLEAESVRE